MGCNTSQEQIQTAPGVDGNVDSHDRHDNGENCDINDKQSDTIDTTKNIIDNINLDKRRLSTELIATKNAEEFCRKDETPGQNSIQIVDNQSAQDIEEEEKAAVKIQATFRGHKVRASMKQGDKSSTMENKSNNATSSSTTTAPSVTAESKKAEDPNEDMTKEQLEAEFDPNDKELCDAATRIQSVFRGHLTRKLQTAEIKDDKDLEEITKKVAEELDIDLTDPELNKAATKIQASFRGYKTRKDHD